MEIDLGTLLIRGAVKGMWSRIELFDDIDVEWECVGDNPRALDVENVVMEAIVAVHWFMLDTKERSNP